MNGNEGEGEIGVSVDYFRKGREAGIVTGSKSEFSFSASKKL